jgi:hypothetical protein
MGRKQFGKPLAVNDVKPFCYILCEGIETELNYFKALVKSAKVSHLNCKFPQEEKKQNREKSKIKDGAAAISLLNEAKELQKARGLEDLAIYWLVFDRDKDTNFPDQLSRVFQTKGIHIAFSNPCFEVWFLYHFKEDCSGFMNCKQVRASLKEHLPNYQKNDPQLYETLKSTRPTAIKNAQRFHQNAIETKPVNKPEWELEGISTVYRLVEALLAS